MMNELKLTKENLDNKKVILYPTDTVWGIGCDATDENSVAKVFQIKNRVESKSLIILVDSLEMLGNYVENIPEAALKILEKTTKPTTIIYNNPKGLAKNVIAQDNTVAIRIVANEFCISLIKEFGKPIVSTSANISGEPTPKSFSEISPSILDSVDYIVNLQQNTVATKSSTILRINEQDEIEVIRE